MIRLFLQTVWACTRCASLDVSVSLSSYFGAGVFLCKKFHNLDLNPHGLQLCTTPTCQWFQPQYNILILINHIFNTIDFVESSDDCTFVIILIYQMAEHQTSKRPPIPIFPIFETNLKKCIWGLLSKWSRSLWWCQWCN